MLTCIYTTTESDTPVTVTYDAYDDLKNFLYDDVSNVKTIKLSGSCSDTDLDYLFSSLEELQSVDLTGLDTSNARSFCGMFFQCYALTSVEFGDIDTSNVDDMDIMFESCEALETVDVSMFDTSKVTDFSYMFNNCDALKTIDVSNWTIKNNASIEGMFYFCSSLTTIYCPNDWSNAGDSDGMFGRATSLVGAISYNASKTNKAYANPTTGYFTIRSSAKPVYHNGTQCASVYFNGTEVNNLYFNGTQIY